MARKNAFVVRDEADREAIREMIAEGFIADETELLAERQQGVEGQSHALENVAGTKLRHYVAVTVFGKDDPDAVYEAVRERSISEAEVRRAWERIAEKVVKGCCGVAAILSIAVTGAFLLGQNPIWIDIGLFLSFATLGVGPKAADMIHKRRFRHVVTEEQQIRQAENGFSELARAAKDGGSWNWMWRMVLPVEAVFAGLASEKPHEVDLAVTVLQQLPHHVLEAGISQFGRYASNDALARLLRLDGPEARLAFALAGPEGARRANMPCKLSALVPPNSDNTAEPAALPAPNDALVSTT